MSYSDDLQTEEWYAFRDSIEDRDQGMCRDCGSSNRLEVHHCCYIPGFKPWEYPEDLMLTLCRGCHVHRQTYETSCHVSLARIIARCPGEKLENLTWDFIKEEIDLAEKNDPERIKLLAKGIVEGVL